MFAPETFVLHCQTSAAAAQEPVVRAGEHARRWFDGLATHLELPVAPQQCQYQRAGTWAATAWVSAAGRRACMVVLQLALVEDDDGCLRPVWVVDAYAADGEDWDGDEVAEVLTGIAEYAHETLGDGGMEPAGMRMSFVGGRALEEPEHG